MLELLEWYEVEDKLREHGLLQGRLTNAEIDELIGGSRCSVSQHLDDVLSKRELNILEIDGEKWHKIDEWHRVPLSKVIANNDWPWYEEVETAYNEDLYGTS